MTRASPNGLRPWNFPSNQQFPLLLLLLLPQLAEHRLGMERVMGIEPIRDSRQINMLVVSGEASAIHMREFAARGALSGNLW